MQSSASYKFGSFLLRIVAGLCMIATGLPLTSGLHTGFAETQKPDEDPKSRAIIVNLATDAASYATGDAVSFVVRVEESCHLTLISIDRDEFATVLYPNDFEQVNYLEAGPAIAIPGKGAPYQLRFDKPGMEKVLAICTKAAQRPLGIGHNFDRERFTILGDWTAFTRSLDKREQDLKAYVARENRRRRRKRGRPPAINLGPPPALGEAEGRTLILIPVSRRNEASHAGGH